jgi:hypothetical protein
MEKRMTKDEALKLALEALGNTWTEPKSEQYKIEKEAITAIKEALAQPEQEPVGQLLEDAFGRGQVMWFNKPKDESMLYTTPKSEKYPQIAINPEIVGYVAPQRTWVGLTYEEKHAIRYSHMTSAEFIDFIEAKLKDKNTRGQE